MGWGNNIPPPPGDKCEVFSPCWCSVSGRENNPHCKSVISVSIQSDILTILLIIAGILLVLNALKIINMRKIYDSISKLLFGGKSCMPNELKSF